MHFNVLLTNVCLSLLGCTLFFYETDGRSGIDHNSIPKHAVWVENSIVQAVPEHPKKDFVFCLSNSLGDAFLFQVGSGRGFYIVVFFFSLSFIPQTREDISALTQISGKILLTPVGLGFSSGSARGRTQ